MPRINGEPKLLAAAKINAKLHARAKALVQSGSTDWATLITEGLRKVLPIYERDHTRQEQAGWGEDKGEGEEGVPPGVKSTSEGGR